MCAPENQKNLKTNGWPYKARKKNIVEFSNFLMRVPHVYVNTKEIRKNTKEKKASGHILSHFFTLSLI